MSGHPRFPSRMTGDYDSYATELEIPGDGAARANDSWVVHVPSRTWGMVMGGTVTATFNRDFHEICVDKAMPLERIKEVRETGGNMAPDCFIDRVHPYQCLMSSALNALHVSGLWDGELG